jgi:hypothetical protein
MNITSLAGKRSAKKSFAIAAPIAAVATAVVLAGAGAAPSTATAQGGDKNGPAVAKVGKSSGDTVKCDGGAQKKVWNRGISDQWVYTTSDGGPTVIQPSVLRIKGPSSGKDVVSVNVSALAYLYDGSTGYVKVLLDGVPMAPANSSTGSVFDTDSGNYYGTFAQNYCKSIGPGYHNFRVVMIDNDGGAAGSFYFYLKDPLIHIEQSE